jgi:hypothetical protein
MGANLPLGWGEREKVIVGEFRHGAAIDGKQGEPDGPGPFKTAEFR